LRKLKLWQALAIDGDKQLKKWQSRDRRIDRKQMADKCLLPAPPAYTNRWPYNREEHVSIKEGMGDLPRD
jgi:hypothetical protein